MSYNNLPEPETCWQAVLHRDSSFDGIFYYAVRSTGIYCKPSCSSRTPRQSQVAYYSNPEAAEAAGFRACKRCQPDRSVTSMDELIARACARLDQAAERISLEELSHELGISPYHLQRVFKAKVGLSPRQYAAARRLERFKSESRHAQDVSSAQYAAGFGSARSLYEHADSQLGMTPAAYRQGGAGTLIQYALLACPFGQLLVAATAKGLCAVRFGDDAQALIESLRQEFPAASLEPTTAGLETWLEMFRAYFAGAPLPADIPLDVWGAPFRLRVWEALRAIPFGQTWSYARVAASIGQPKAVRAVANACAANPVALVTPCHRVVRSDGGLGGYRWGVARKQQLLEKERFAVEEIGYG